MADQERVRPDGCKRKASSWKKKLLKMPEDHGDVPAHLRRDQVKRGMTARQKRTKLH